jgi:hypothetical protein
METLDQLDLDAFLAIEELDREALRQYLSQGQSAYTSVANLTTKNQQILEEKRLAAEKAAKFDSALKAKNLTLDDINNWNPNPGNDEIVKKFETQLNETRASHDNEKSEWQKNYDAVVAERDSLNKTITGGKIQQEFNKVAALSGVDASSIEDLYIIAQARGVELTINDQGQVRGKRPGDVVDSDLKNLLATLKADASYQKFYTGKFVTGSGNQGGAGAGGAVSNPWEKGKENLTEQTRIYKQSPELAAQMQKLAGA